MSGLGFVQVLANGALPLNMIAPTLGYDVAEAESGRVVVISLPTGADLSGPDPAHARPAQAYRHVAA